jgi:hypothetical protein
LGQARDYTAVAVVEHGRSALRVRHVERVALGTSYVAVVERVARVAREALASRVVVDGTGVGAPVVDLLREALPAAVLVPVMITSGERARFVGGRWRVPKGVLIGGLRSLMESGELEIAATFREVLGKELAGMRLKMGRGRERMQGRGHDDLVLAVALGTWGER